MPEILTLPAAMIVVFFFVHHHFRRRDLPPKARLICDVWKEVEMDDKEGKLQYTAVKLAFSKNS